jgi:tRNA-dihydrouridine synthase
VRRSGHLQLRTSGEENLEAAVAKLERQNPLAIDLNLGCPAPEIQKQASGAALFRDFPRLEQVLKRIRACYNRNPNRQMQAGG